MNNTLRFIISIAIPLLIGSSGAFFTVTGINSWYQTIQKPSWNPPNWVFGPVWTTLYILMGIALYLVWKQQDQDAAKRTAILLFAVQLVLNFFWSLIFFKWQQPGWAFAELAVMWIVILLTILQFSKISNAAAWLLVPYISWVSFAGILNYTIWRLN